HQADQPRAALLRRSAGVGALAGGPVDRAPWPARGVQAAIPIEDRYIGSGGVSDPDRTRRRVELKVLNLPCHELRNLVAAANFLFAFDRAGWWRDNLERFLVGLRGMVMRRMEGSASGRGRAAQPTAWVIQPARSKR